MRVRERRGQVDRGHKELSVRRQCELLGIARSGLYYTAKGESQENLGFMRLIDEQYMRTPFYGVPRMTVMLRRSGYVINPKRVRRLMRVMGLMAIYPKPQTSKKHPDNEIYPYLLRGLAVERPNQVWAVDITYIGLSRGFVYLVAILDWHSRYILSWELSNSLDSLFCVEALKRALRKARPEIMNTDQGVQFTSRQFTEVLKDQGIRISMDSKGRALDNVFVERFWRSLKYEDIYLKRYETVDDLYAGIDRYMKFYNQERPHQGLEYQTPAEVYWATARKGANKLAA